METIHEFKNFSVVIRDCESGFIARYLSIDIKAELIRGKGLLFKVVSPETGEDIYIKSYSCPQIYEYDYEDMAIYTIGVSKINDGTEQHGNYISKEVYLDIMQKLDDYISNLKFSILDIF